MDNKADILYKKLTKLFSRGTIVRHSSNSGKIEVKDLDLARGLIGKISGFRRTTNSIYADMMSQQANKIGRMFEYDLMEQTPEISAALDIYADETCSKNIDDELLNITSDDKRIQEILENLFNDILNVRLHLWNAARGMVKYGDFYWLLDVHEEYGITGFVSIDPDLIERIEGQDPENPNYVQFKFVGLGSSMYNSAKNFNIDEKTMLQSWQIAHFRLLVDNKFLPNGRSMLEPVRKIWKQLILLEDAMLVYRITRAPERRVFKVDISSLAPKDIPTYINKVKNEMKRQPVVDPNTGNVNLKFNVAALDEDIFIPVRGDKASSAVETLPGAQNLSDIEDIKYIREKMFAGLKIPPSYLAHESDINSKSTLSNEDLKFARTIQRIQDSLISELVKIAIIHLYLLGYENEDLINFNISLNSPSTLSEQMKLELIKSKVEVSQEALNAGMFSRKWILDNIMRLSEEEISILNKQLISDKKFTYYTNFTEQQGITPEEYNKQKQEQQQKIDNVHNKQSKDVENENADTSVVDKLQNKNTFENKKVVKRNAIDLLIERNEKIINSL